MGIFLLRIWSKKSSYTISKSKMISRR